MDCNNKYCYWRMFEQCCHEDEEVHGNPSLQLPNQLDCPSTLRSDFEVSLLLLYNDLHPLVDKIILKRANFGKMVKLHKILLG